MTFANLSGGRDSTAMVVRWCELGNKLDYVLFCDTGYEFPAMYEYIDKIDGYLQRNYDIAITRLDSTSEMHKWAFEMPITKGERKGRFRGLPMRAQHDYCTRETKIAPSKRFVLGKSPNKFKNEVLIGYTYGEVERGRTSNLEYAISRYPLHEWQWNESEVSDYLKARGIMNPLYERFERTGCYLCPKQNLKAFETLYKHYKKEWQAMREWENKAIELDCVNKHWHDRYSMAELERRFRDNANTLFECEIENERFSLMETCFCKG